MLYALLVVIITLMIRLLQNVVCSRCFYLFNSCECDVNMLNENSLCFRYPVKIAELKIMGHAAQIRMFREDEQSNSFFFSIAFPEITDADNDDFILEKGLNYAPFQECGFFIIEDTPELVVGIGGDVQISWSINNSSTSGVLVEISINIKNTNIDGVVVFYRDSFPNLSV